MTSRAPSPSTSTSATASESSVPLSIAVGVRQDVRARFDADRGRRERDVAGGTGGGVRPVVAAARDLPAGDRRAVRDGDAARGVDGDVSEAATADEPLEDDVADDGQLQRILGA